ncbi:hypothetical protein BC833DRAFT_653585 [Globomyces pollinis-pini]|nr:hypothetical protein BC833DRAFT_653585 [Globomyces pollinis-pini]
MQFTYLFLLTVVLASPVVDVCDAGYTTTEDPTTTTTIAGPTTTAEDPTTTTEDPTTTASPTPTDDVGVICHTNSGVGNTGWNAIDANSNSWTNGAGHFGHEYDCTQFAGSDPAKARPCRNFQLTNNGQGNGQLNFCVNPWGCTLGNVGTPVTSNDDCSDNKNKGKKVMLWYPVIGTCFPDPAQGGPVPASITSVIKPFDCPSK